MAVPSASILRSLGYAVLLLSTPLVQGEGPQLNGAHFRITGLEENGFLDAATNLSAPFNVTFSGYLKLMLDAIAKPSRANFTYTLLPPSGYGTSCDDGNLTLPPYDAHYRTQYNCGADDVNDLPLRNTSTDMYLGMYYVTPTRQLINQFTLPFLPPFSGTLAMFGTATGIANFQQLVQEQELGNQPAACAPAGTALIKFVNESFPGIQLQGIYGGEEDILDAFQTGNCTIYITDRPIAAQFVLRRFEANECMANGMPIGVIGDPMNFGLSHYAIGIRLDLPIEIERTLSYWLNVLMSCNPHDDNGPCPEGNLASFYERSAGTGSECGYVLYPPSDEPVSPGIIAAIVVVSVVVVVILYTFFHWYRLARQKRLYAKRSKAAMKIAERERELNEFIAHEVRNPLSSAIAALNFVSSKTSDPMLVPEHESRESIKSDIHVIDSSLQFVNELLRNMLDLHRSTDKIMKLHMEPTDILRDILEPVASILFMRGAKVDILVDCPQNLIVNADRMRLKQILLNLAANASKFVEQGYIRLRAEVVDNDNVEMHVEDSGPGIPTEKQQQLFAKFQESLDVLNQGTGIGLCVCKNLSKLMGADLFLDNTFESGVSECPGTRFTLRLNQAPLDIENGFGTLEPDEMANATKDLPEGLSVLFVDDDTMIRKMFSRTLRNVAPTWTIREASSGETALRIVGEDHFDIIFVDHYMASHTKQLLGTETTHAFRTKGVNSIICGLSANDKEEEFLQAGANAFMLKPFPCKKEALKRELLRLLETREQAPSAGSKITDGNPASLPDERRLSMPSEVEERTECPTDDSA